MKKSVKILVVLFILAVMLGSIITVYINYREEKQKEAGQKIVEVKDYYKITRKNNRYTLQSNNSNFEGVKLSNIFYDNKYVYLYLEGEDVATLLKYNIKKDEVLVLFENSKEIYGGISKVGEYYKIGKYIYDKNFKRLKEYPTINNDEIIFNNLKYKLVKKDDGVVKVDLNTGDETELLKNEDDITYAPYLVSDDGKIIILKTQKNNETSLVYLNDDNLPLGLDVTTNSEGDKSYRLLSDDSYLLETISFENYNQYNVYDILNNRKIYTSQKKYSNFVFNDSKFMCTNENNDVIFGDYINGEERVLINKDNVKGEINNFISASDNYSVIVSFKDDNKSFYIFYL